MPASLWLQEKINGSLRQRIRGRLFTRLESEALGEILRLGRVQNVKPKTNIVFSGDRPENLYLLLGGKARSYVLTESGSEVLVMWLVPGDTIGLVSLLPNPPNYLASAATVSDCEFLTWDHATIRELAKVYPQLTENGFRLALHYLAVYMKRHANIISRTAHQRLAQALLDLAAKAGDVHPSGVAIDISNEQLSSLSDISPFTASRLLSKCEREGALRKERGRVTLLAPEFLMVA